MATQCAMNERVENRQFSERIAEPNFREQLRIWNQEKERARLNRMHEQREVSF